MSRLPLRPYQQSAVEAVRAAWAGGMRRPAVVLPTGTGKTVVLGKLGADLVDERAGRVLVIAHRTELITQAAAKLALMSGRRVGVVQATRNEVGAPIVVGSVMSLATRERRAQIRDVAAVVVDECHHATAATYLDILGHYGCLDDRPSGRSDGKRAVAVGFTATMIRGDRVGLGLVWDDVVYEQPIAPMIRAGYLVEPRGIVVEVADLDLDGVRRSRGDWQDGALGEAMSDSMAPELILKAWLEHASGRPTVGFAPTVKFARIMAETFRDAGIASAVVHGKQTTAEREKVWRDVESGAVLVVWNCAVATEGTDVPRWSCAIIARLTGHVGLYMQMVGRILRPHPGKNDALVLDVAGISRRHRIASVVDLIGVEDVEPTERDDVTDGDDVADTPLRDWEEPDKPYRVGNTVWEEIDLFHGSRLVWLQTFGGTWFLPAGNRYIAIVPSVYGAGWDVVAVESWHGGATYLIEGAVPDVGYAMAFGEGAVTPAEAEIAARDAKFRSKPLTAPEARRAAKLGLGHVTRGELIAAEVRRAGSLRVDPIAHWAVSRRGGR